MPRRRDDRDDDDRDDDDRPRRSSRRSSRRDDDDEDEDDDEDRRPRRRSSRRDDDDDDDYRPRRRSRGQSFHCPYCDSERTPVVKKETSQVGWIVFFVLLCSVAFCWLCWVGFFITEDKRMCRDCGMKLG